MDNLPNVLICLNNLSISADFTVYEDFFSYKSGVYVHTTGGPVGGHAIKMLGFVSVFCFIIFDVSSIDLTSLHNLRDTHTCTHWHSKLAANLDKMWTFIL